MAFRTRCPSCGTLFSAPDDMIEREIRCPRCKDSFIAREEIQSAPPPPPPSPPGIPLQPDASLSRPGAPLPSEQAPGEGVAGQTIQHYCKVCNAAFTEEDILDGLAVRRFEDVYCRKHFRSEHPDECEQHPGTKAVTQCGRCGMPLCQNCVIEVQGERLCSRCKRRVLGELRGDFTPGAAFAYGERPGLPWEQEGGSFFGRMFGTIKEVLFSPGQAFQKMYLTGGYGKPWLYNWLIQSFTMVILVIWMLIFFSLIMGQFTQIMNEQNPNQNIPNMEGMMVGILIFYLFLGIAIAAIVPFIAAAIYHVCLMIVGGAKESYECTFRVVSYGNGSLTILNVLPLAFIPLLGNLWQLGLLVWMAIVMIKGFSRAHNISGGKAAFAFFLPFIVCCGFFIAFFVLALSTMPRM